MGMAPPRTCRVPKCGRVNCTQHPSVPWRPRTQVAVPRVRGRALQQRRARLFARSPYCVHCIARGIYFTRATIRDHVIPLAEGGADDETNEQALCGPCSDAKTNEEAQRGVRRSQMVHAR